MYIGGKDTKMAKAIAKALRKKDFTVKESPKEINAQSDDNFVNKMIQIQSTTRIDHCTARGIFKHHKLDKTTRGNPKNIQEIFISLRTL